MRQTIYGTVLYIILIIPPVISLLESVMILHMLVQFPLLMIVGYLWGKSILEKYDHFFTKWNTTGVAGILVVFIDRKSTRLNSSHVSISYAVFCLKKKKKSV